MVFALRNIVRSNAGYVKKYWFYKENLPIISVRHHSYDPDGKTTVQILNRNVEGLMINSYSQFGFRLNNGMYILGPMAIFPRTVLSWNVGSERDINEDSLSLFCLLEPKIDILVLGVGDVRSSSVLDKSVLTFMTKYRISIEVLTTEQACATFNFLNSENRCVGGALIPPKTLRPTDDDVFMSKKRHKRLYGSGDDD
ncbi:NADH dehydrogenase [ubiquinone] 1 alpha subcomplex assembly factor 3 [Zootermopsis nevadensis]|uniref:NADH dehydrogenase [ubiquinone] 1 alpha subcomplex assembly factor 3 n=1 Tax=Zootermopsis nevadensis TaxID=136037 RepID=A0A067R8Z8_ZOONE|nr:NADH dehydrogenase [ubiquinone] 1 alpha subcomplex assembly factor 3 [Zootermopsis nevadensis]